MPLKIVFLRAQKWVSTRLKLVTKPYHKSTTTAVKGEQKGMDIL